MPADRGHRVERCEWVPVAPGVKRQQFEHADQFVGTAEALAAAGLVRLEQLPGAPGMPKVSVRVFPDGTVPSGPGAYRQHREAGARRITWLSKSKRIVRVIVLVGWREELRRWEAAEVQRQWARLREAARAAEAEAAAVARCSPERDARFQAWLSSAVAGAAGQGGEVAG